MSYKEFSQDIEDRGQEAPIFGSFGGDAPPVPTEGTTERIVVRYFVANLSDPEDRQMIEHIMTTSLTCRNELNKVGDIMVLREETTYDRDGNYLASVKYCERTRDEAHLDDAIERAEASSEPVEEGEPIGELPSHDF